MGWLGIVLLGLVTGRLLADVVGVVAVVVVENSARRGCLEERWACCSQKSCLNTMKELCTSQYLAVGMR